MRNQTYDWDITLVNQHGLPADMLELLLKGGVPYGVVNEYERLQQQYTRGTLLYQLQERRN